MWSQVAALSLEQSKLRTAVSMAVASVAKEDFPDRWEGLIPHLMNMLQVHVAVHTRNQLTDVFHGACRPMLAPVSSI